MKTKLLSTALALSWLITFILLSGLSSAQNLPAPILCLDYVTLTPTRTTIALTTTLSPFPTELHYVTPVDPRRTKETLEYNPIFQTATAYPTPTQEIWDSYQVRVNVLNVRQTASTSAPVMAQLTYLQVVSITQTLTSGNILWGKLESGYFVAISQGGNVYLVKQ